MHSWWSYRRSVTMTLHKISAGDGYTYLTRQVAAGDNTDRSRDSLASYYGHRGESPGQWQGRLAAAIGVDGVVSEAQMLALFGEGRHPDATRLEEAAVAAGMTPTAAAQMTRLGRPFPVYDVTSQFPSVLAEAYADHNTARGDRSRAPIDNGTRAEIRTRVARDMFAAQYGRPVADPRELSGWIARNTRPDKVAVAGYDLTFSPVKSVSVLWALAPREVANEVAAAHAAAVALVLERIETEAAYTRQGAHGVRQVRVDGVIAAAFTHRSSRAGDPDLHTHVTVAAKVRAPDNSWLTLDGRMLYKGNVTYSEMYNSALETELVQRLPGLRFTDVARSGPGAGDKRAVRELAGLDAALLSLMSKRAAAIEPRRAELAAQFVRDHGRTPTRSEQLALAQQATLDTREAKKEQRTHAEERAAWRKEAQAALGADGLSRSLERTLTTRGQQPSRLPLTSDQLVRIAASACLETVAERRAVWQEWHVRAEAQRQVRHLVERLDPAGNWPAEAVQELVDAATERALTDDVVVALAAPEPVVATPAALLNPDGRSQYSVFRAATFTTHATLAAEARIVATAGLRDGRRADPVAVETAVLESHANGKTLNTGQTSLVRDLATSGARFQLALAPAGSGKTTAMTALARGWQLSGGTVVGLAPSAAAASELSTSIGQNADTVDKLVHELDRAASDPSHRLPRWVTGVNDATLIVIDEVSLASTVHLDRVLAFAVERGASVRGVGDPAQRSSVAAGGVMRDVETTHGAVSLAEVMRFADPTEGAASLALRAGDPTAVAHYLDKGRVHVGDLDTSLTAVYEGWATDRARGVDAVMLAPLRDQVAALNVRARADRLAALEADGRPVGPEAALAQGQQASVGDVIQTRRNDRSLSLGVTDFVRNGYRFGVDSVADDGSVLARHLETGRRVSLSAAYLAAHTELGYARTVAAAQGMTAGGMVVDDGVSVRVEGASHVLVDPDVMDRESFYVAMTRGTAANHAYVVATGRGDEHAGPRPDTVAPATAAELLARVLGRSSVQVSATSEVAATADPFRQLAPAVNQYADALRVGAADVLGPAVITQLAQRAELIVPGVTDAPAWPTLSGHLALLELAGRYRGEDGAAMTAMTAAVATRELSGSTDLAAVVDWRIDLASSGRGPLPWLPAVPAALRNDPTWGPFLLDLTQRVGTLAAGVGECASRWTDTQLANEVPVWARSLVAAGAHERSVTRLAVWRAAHDVNDSDLRPTGPPVLAEPERLEQRELNRAAAGYGVNADADAQAMAQLADRLEPRLLDDPYWPQLATRLRAVERSGVEVASLVAAAVRGEGPLPDEQAAAALWWRLTRHLAPNLDVDALDSGGTPRPAWSAQLDELVGVVAAEAVLTAAAWPALVARIDAAARDGFEASELLADGLTSAARAGVAPGELATAVLWHVSLLADPAPLFLEDLPPDPADVGADAWPDLAGADLAAAVAEEVLQSTSVELGDGLLAVPTTVYADLSPAHRVTALQAELAIARSELVELTHAVMSDQGPHVAAVMPQLRVLRQRADELVPLVAARDFARADWHVADVALADAQARLVAARAASDVVEGQSRSGEPTMEVVMEEQYAEYARDAAQLAYDQFTAAQIALESATSGEVVTHGDVTRLWQVASDLDLGELNDRRVSVQNRRDSLWRAEAATAHHDVALPPDVVASVDGLDYGVLTRGDADPWQGLTAADLDNGVSM